MRILMLCPLISSSSFITTYPYAKILSKRHDVKIAGPLLGKEPYIKDNKLDFDFVEPSIKRPIQFAFMDLYRKNKSYIKQQKFDAIHCFKLLPHTAPVGAYAKRALGKKFILTIDDYDTAGPKNPIKKKVLEWAESFYRKADAITVSSMFLQKIYGGTVIYQVANEYAFTKRKPNPERFKKKYNIGGKKIIAHAGTLFEFKGIDILIKSVQRLDKNGVQLVISGEPTKPYKKLAGRETILTGKIPMEDVVDLTAAADIYAIPTRDTLYSRAEIPAKIFEAMMLGRPIVASRLSDIPIILDNGKCGLLARPDSISDLSSKIKLLLDKPALGKYLGKMAKRRYAKKYSYMQKENVINDIYSRLL